MDVITRLERINQTLTAYPRSAASAVFAVSAMLTLWLVADPAPPLSDHVESRSLQPQPTTTAAPQRAELAVADSPQRLGPARVAMVSDPADVAVLTRLQPWPADAIYRWEDSRGRAVFGDAAAANTLRVSMQQLRVSPNVVATPKQQLAASGGDSSRCRRAEATLEAIRERMRRGYAAAEQQRLHERELKAMAERRQYCR